MAKGCSVLGLLYCNLVYVLRTDLAKLSYCRSSSVCCSKSVLCGVGANDSPLFSNFKSCWLKLCVLKLWIVKAVVVGGGGLAIKNAYYCWGAHLFSVSFLVLSSGLLW